MKCNKCQENLSNNVKFCGKCGTKVEHASEYIVNTKSNDFTEEKNVRAVKSVGSIFGIFGYIKIIVGVGMFCLILSGSSLSSVGSFGYADSVLSIFIGTLWVILGGRIQRNVDKFTRKYLLVILLVLVVTTSLTFVATVASGGHGYAGVLVAVLLITQVSKGLGNLKHINTNSRGIKYSFRGWKWFGFIFIFLIAIVIASFFDLVRQ